MTGNSKLGKSKVNVEFDHKEVEARWSSRWLTDNIYRAIDFSDKPKKYILVEFPYPSGSGLHCGHVYRFTMPDVYARKLRMSGYNVLFPIGWDAFGLPAENYAVKTGIHPAETTKAAVETYRQQMRMMGYSFDWEREVDTTSPNYYKWTQWIFLKLWEAGLAELREQPVWWCEALKTVLANEEVQEDSAGNKISERGEHPVEKRNLKQWVLKMPDYADKLLAGLESVDFPESIKSAQANWIGRSVGAKLKFPLNVPGKSLEVFTTRPDTILGATFMVVAPEHPLMSEVQASVTNWDEVRSYIEQSKNKSDLERKASKEKSGVCIRGVTAKNPFAPLLPEIPIYVADYVLMDYGTGAIMAVPAHDERDFEFAKKHDLAVIATVSSLEPDHELPYTVETGTIILNEVAKQIIPAADLKSNGGEFSTEAFKEYVISKLSTQGLAERKITFKLRDWLFSRQRYWGEPIPLIHCESGQIEPVANTSDPEDVKKKLPLLLPEVPDYLPSSDGFSPLSKATDWVSTTDSKGEKAKRETNTMPNWAGSCWYYLRYLDPKNDDTFAAFDKMKYWLPVDRYFGGSEHTTLHLLYSRFWHKFLYDQKLVPTSEPYAWRMNGGILLGADSQKMSKSVGNVINPDDKVASYGADALRLYINFMGPYDSTLPWSENGLKACRKLIERIFALHAKVVLDPNQESFERHYHKFIKRVTSMYDNLKSNTAVSEIMIFVREAEAVDRINIEIWKGFLKAIAPLAVFAAEELWHRTHEWTDWQPERSIHLQSWPEFDERLAHDEKVVIGVQVNGKLRAQVEVNVEEDQESVKARVLELEALKKWIDGKEIKKFVYVKGRIVSLVIS